MRRIDLIALSVVLIGLAATHAVAAPDALSQQKAVAGVAQITDPVKIDPIVTGATQQAVQKNRPSLKVICDRDCQLERLKAWDDKFAK